MSGQVPEGTVARIRVERGATTEFPVAEKVADGWQTGVHFYPDESVTEVTGIYVWHPREVHAAVLDSATEEAIARYDGDVDRETGAAVDDWGYSACQRQAFVAGALFESGRNSPHIRRAVIEELIAKARAIPGRDARESLFKSVIATWLNAALNEEGDDRG